MSSLPPRFRAAEELVRPRPALESLRTDEVEAVRPRMGGRMPDGEVTGIAEGGLDVDGCRGRVPPALTPAAGSDEADEAFDSANALAAGVLGGGPKPSNVSSSIAGALRSTRARMR